MSDSLQPHGLYSPWNSPGRNTGVGSLSLLQGHLHTPVVERRSPELQAVYLPAEPPGMPFTTRLCCRLRQTFKKLVRMEHSLDDKEQSREFWKALSF